MEIRGNKERKEGEKKNKREKRKRERALWPILI